MRKLLPVILGFLGLIAGVGAGYVLRPATEASTADGHDAAPTAAAKAESEVAGPAEAAPSHAENPDHSPQSAASAEGGAGHGEEGAAKPTEFVKLNNQFVVPIIRSEHVGALAILSLTLEVKTGNSEAVFTAEPKLRDSFLQVLFDYANADGFDGAFTQSGRMARLRKALAEPARVILGDMFVDVLIVDIVRQDT